MYILKQSRMRVLEDLPPYLAASTGLAKLTAFSCSLPLTVSLAVTAAKVPILHMFLYSFSVLSY